MHDTLYDLCLISIGVLIGLACSEWIGVPVP